MTVRAHVEARRTDTARPMPLDPPVTSAVKSFCIGWVRPFAVRSKVLADILHEPPYREFLSDVGCAQAVPESPHHLGLVDLRAQFLLEAEADIQNIQRLRAEVVNDLRVHGGSRGVDPEGPHHDGDDCFREL